MILFDYDITIPVQMLVLAWMAHICFLLCRDMDFIEHPEQEHVTPAQVNEEVKQQVNKSIQETPEKYTEGFAKSLEDGETIQCNVEYNHTL